MLFFANRCKIDRFWIDSHCLFKKNICYALCDVYQHKFLKNQRPSWGYPKYSFRSLWSVYQKKSLDKLIIHRNLSKINHNCTDYWICLVYIYNTLILRCFLFYLKIIDNSLTPHNFTFEKKNSLIINKVIHSICWLLFSIPYFN